MMPKAQVFIFACLVRLVCSHTSDSSEECGAAGACPEKMTAALLQVTNVQTRTAIAAEAPEQPKPPRTGYTEVDKTYVKATVEDLALPPSQGPILWSMIRSEPWNCEMVPDGDPRQGSCNIDPNDEALKPENIACIERDDHGLTCSIEHANSWRTMHQVGALPCCSTEPFCAAPVCAAEPAPLSKKDHTCTKRKSKENVAYLKKDSTWPAYHGWGGSFELDTLKFLDMLACRGPPEKCPVTPFDLAIDLGANTGYYTEKLSVRNWAKNYIMIEANPMTSAVLNVRWGEDEWRKKWFTEQVKLKKDQALPEIAIVTKPLSNHSDGVLDMCATEGSMATAEAGCIVPIEKVDDIIPAKLADNFQEHFKKAHSAFLKVDTEGMDELVLRGMSKLFKETRGAYKDGSSKYLLNFLQFEYSPALMAVAKKREGFTKYDLKSVTVYLESIGFESFMIGPRYLPLSHGSWNDEFLTLTEDPNNNAGKQSNYPNFAGGLCPYCKDMPMPSFTSDIFAMRSSHPRATEIKLALGACQESKDFSIHDEQYDFEQSLVLSTPAEKDQQTEEDKEK